MPFKPTTSPAPRKRPAPQPAPVLVTMAFTVSITNPEAVVSAVRVVLGGRGMSDADALARIDDGTGHADLGKCIEALMEESVAALGGATGADIGGIETYLETVETPSNAVHSNAD